MSARAVNPSLQINLGGSNLGIREREYRSKFAKSRLVEMNPNGGQWRCKSQNQVLINHIFGLFSTTVSGARHLKMQQAVHSHCRCITLTSGIFYYPLVIPTPNNTEIHSSCNTSNH